MFRHLSIRIKLTALLVGTVGIVLLTVSVATLIADVRSIRERLVGRYSTLATVVAANSAAALSIADIDSSGAQEVVSDFAVEPTIVFAALYDANGKGVARYQSAQLGEEVPTPPQGVGAIYTKDDFLDVVHEVTLKDGRVIGRLFIRATLQILNVEVERKLTIAAAVFGGALLFALVISIPLQRLISRPILSLVDVAARVSSEHDYSLRAPKLGQDELGVLSDGFNEMLAEVERRDDELREHRLHLEETVEHRTRSLKIRTEELSRSNTELEQFAYIASHDLQEPLRKVQAFGDMLASQYHDALGDDGRDYLRRMGDAANRMQVLINDLLNFSRVMTKARPFEPVNLQDVVRLVVLDLEVRIQQTEGRVEVGNLPVIDADPLQMRQLLQNLIGNALKFRRPSTPPTVTVQAQVIHDAPLEPGATQAAATCEITVRDNGIGFHEKYAERIFEPFERLHGRSEYEGTGMGLAICRKIVERHGGSITAHGTPDVGAVFVAKLPMKHTEERAT